MWCCHLLFDRTIAVFPRKFFHSVDSASSCIRFTVYFVFSVDQFMTQWGDDNCVPGWVVESCVECSRSESSAWLDHSKMKRLGDGSFVQDLGQQKGPPKRTSSLRLEPTTMDLMCTANKHTGPFILCPCLLTHVCIEKNLSRSLFLLCWDEKKTMIRSPTEYHSNMPTSTIFLYPLFKKNNHPY